MSVSTLRPKGIAAKVKEIRLKADENLFGMTNVVVQTRNLGMKNVLSHLLSPMLWSLAAGEGTLRKKSKAVLSNNLKKRINTF